MRSYQISPHLTLCSSSMQRNRDKIVEEIHSKLYGSQTKVTSKNLVKCSKNSTSYDKDNSTSFKQVFTRWSSWKLSMENKWTMLSYLPISQVFLVECFTQMLAMKMLHHRLDYTPKSPPLINMHTLESRGLIFWL